ncbi:uncharacterized protein zmp:0000000991 [Polypterus senegalus]|uniref:uncharacterized protein zmp:0000000991 n=1 Tax=Polypterus senegalus TaxID=55291 RepID=UPI001965FD97|nr:uncharacterized protein zmp:0000000991 [Polypterus senegalus]
MTTAATHLDLSFLNKDEADKILEVLERDEQLKRAERQRISKLQHAKKDLKWLHGVTGQWFEEIQKKKLKKDGHQSIVTQSHSPAFKKKSRSEVKLTKAKSLPDHKDDMNTASVWNRSQFRTKLSSIFTIKIPGKRDTKLSIGKQIVTDQNAGRQIDTKNYEQAKLNPINQESNISQQSYGKNSTSSEIHMDEETLNVLEQLDKKLAEEKSVHVQNSEKYSETVSQRRFEDDLGEKSFPCSTHNVATSHENLYKPSSPLNGKTGYIFPSQYRSKKEMESTSSFERTVKNIAITSEETTVKLDQIKSTTYSLKEPSSKFRELYKPKLQRWQSLGTFENSDNGNISKNKYNTLQCVPTKTSMSDLARDESLTESRKKRDFFQLYSYRDTLEKHQKCGTSKQHLATDANRNTMLPISPPLRSLMVITKEFNGNGDICSYRAELLPRNKDNTLKANHHPTRHNFPEVKNDKVGSWLMDISNSDPRDYENVQNVEVADDLKKNRTSGRTYISDLYKNLHSTSPRDDGFKSNVCKSSEVPSLQKFKTCTIASASQHQFQSQNAPISYFLEDTPNSTSTCEPSMSKRFADSNLVKEPDAQNWPFQGVDIPTMTSSESTKEICHSPNNTSFQYSDPMAGRRPLSSGENLNVKGLPSPTRFSPSSSRHVLVTPKEHTSSSPISGADNECLVLSNTGKPLSPGIKGNPISPAMVLRKEGNHGIMRSPTFSYAIVQPINNQTSESISNSANVTAGSMRNDYLQIGSPKETMTQRPFSPADDRTFTTEGKGYATINYMNNPDRKIRSSSPALNSPTSPFRNSHTKHVVCNYPSPKYFSSPKSASPLGFFTSNEKTIDEPIGSSSTYLWENQIFSNKENRSNTLSSTDSVFDSYESRNDSRSPNVYPTTLSPATHEFTHTSLPSVFTKEYGSRVSVPFSHKLKSSTSGLDHEEVSSSQMESEKGHTKYSCESPKTSPRANIYKSEKSKESLTVPRKDMQIARNHSAVRLPNQVPNDRNCAQIKPNTLADLGSGKTILQNIQESYSSKGIIDFGETNKKDSNVSLNMGSNDENYLFGGRQECLISSSKVNKEEPFPFEKRTDLEESSTSAQQMLNLSKIKGGIYSENIPDTENNKNMYTTVQGFGSSSVNNQQNELRHALRLSYADKNRNILVNNDLMDSNSRWTGDLTHQKSTAFSYTEDLQDKENHPTLNSNRLKDLNVITNYFSSRSLGYRTGRTYSENSYYNDKIFHGKTVNTMKQSPFFRSQWDLNYSEDAENENEIMYKNPKPLFNYNAINREDILKHKIKSSKSLMDINVSSSNDNSINLDLKSNSYYSVYHVQKDKQDKKRRISTGPPISPPAKHSPLYRSYSEQLNYSLSNENESLHFPTNETILNKNNYRRRLPEISIYGEEQQAKFLEHVKRSLTEGRLWRPGDLISPLSPRRAGLPFVDRKRTFSSASTGSLTSQESISPRERMPSKSYRSSLSAFEESDTDTTTDDEYYLNDNENEKESEL